MADKTTYIYDFKQRTIKLEKHLCKLPALIVAAGRVLRLLTTGLVIVLLFY